MSGPLDEAWEWYLGVRQTAVVSRRIAGVWDELREQVFSPVEGQRLPTGDQLDASAGAALREVDDIAVLYLFANFETLIRDDVLARIDAERTALAPTHPLLVGAMATLDRQIKQGNVAELLDAYNTGVDAKLRAIQTEVREVREYRNWVAHGRRGPSPQLSVNMTPEIAKDRLEDFLSAVRAYPVA